MNKIDVSIWGIRAGFEDGGIFHSHNFSDVKELQKDKFRALADLSRPKNSYMINRTIAHTVITIIHTDTFEFSVSGSPRSGYLAISLIFPKNKALVASPRLFLQQFVQWYKKVQGNSRVNNFTAEQIQGIVGQLTLVDSVLNGVPGKKAIAFKSETELDTNLSGGSKYTPFEETIFYDASVDFRQSGLNNEVIPMSKIIDSVEKEEEKRRIEEEQYRAKQQQIAEKESELFELKKLGHIDQMIEVFDKFQLNYLLSPSIRNEIETIKQRRAETLQSQQEQQKVDEIIRLIHDDNLELASAKFDLLRERNRLPEDSLRMIARYRDDMRNEKIQREQERIKADNRARKKRVIIISSVVGGFIILAVLSIMSVLLELPLAMYDNDGDKIANSMDKCPDEYGKLNGCPDKDKDGFSDDVDMCPDEYGKLNGCPDTDDDGLSDQDEKAAGTDPNKKDTDGDGVNDKEDECPLEKGSVENKGCIADTVKRIPEPVELDLNKKVTITYNGIKYSIKKGFTTENGMPFGEKSPLPNWRFKSNKWEKEPTPGSGNWESATQNDIDHVLSRCATKINSDNNQNVGSNTSGGAARPSPIPPTTALSVISPEDKKILKVLKESFLKDAQSSITIENKKMWDEKYKVLYSTKKNKSIRQDDTIEKWNREINDLNVTP